MKRVEGVGVQVGNRYQVLRGTAGEVTPVPDGGMRVAKSVYVDKTIFIVFGAASIISEV